MSEDIKEQIVTEIKDKSLFGLFSIQINESVDVASLLSNESPKPNKKIKNRDLFNLCKKLVIPKPYNRFCQG